MLLSQIYSWIEYACVGIEVLLLLRVLSLRLFKKYFFITLFCVLTVLFDVASIYYGRSDLYERAVLNILIGSNFFAAFIYPLCAWEVFEDFPSSLTAFRNAAMTQTVGLLVVIAIIGLVIGSVVDEKAFQFDFSLILSTSAASGSLGFLWACHQAARRAAKQLSHNTVVWTIFFEVFLSIQILGALFLYLRLSLGFPTGVAQGAGIAFNASLIAISFWCAVKLRASQASSGVGPQSESA